MGMKLKFDIENMGNIDKATIIIKPLTIIAGENSSGKTFVTKGLYTLLDFIYRDNNLLDISFKKNFQITSLESLINKNNYQNLKLSLESFIDIEIDKNQNIDYKVMVDDLNSLENIIFFDSPLYTKIRKAVEKNSNSIKNEDKYLKGYPQYIEQFYEFIDKEYIDIPDFSDISQEIQEIINGRLEVSQSGDINYKDNQNNIIPISLTAMGISNIGVIDLLLRNNIINKGSFLIMDEPEVHLHPKWQVFLAQILYKIAKSGANIIIATHSLDFLKAFENILKEDGEKAEEIISINQMPYDEKNLELSELEKVGLVLDDLSKPFYNLYMKDI
ncbi:MAG: AAA family ATPase [Sulfurovum sp.]